MCCVRFCLSIVRPCVYARPFAAARPMVAEWLHGRPCSDHVVQDGACDWVSTQVPTDRVRGRPPVCEPIRVPITRSQRYRTQSERRKKGEKPEISFASALSSGANWQRTRSCGLLSWDRPSRSKASYCSHARPLDPLHPHSESLAAPHGCIRTPASPPGGAVILHRAFGQIKPRAPFEWCHACAARHGNAEP